MLLYVQKTSAETRGCHRQLTSIGHSQTQILELKMITSLSKKSSL